MIINLRPYRLLHSILIVAFLISFLTGCEIFSQSGSRPEDEWGIKTATGSFSETTFRSDCVYQENSITLSWQINISSGETRPDVTGNGKLTVVCGETSTTSVFIFKGTISEDGNTYTGTVDRTGVDVISGDSFDFSFTNEWRASRSGDYIDGEVNGSGPFTLRLD